MKNLKELYSDLINEVIVNKDKYKEEDLVLFTAAKGNRYQKDLMIIGRAVNDWDIVMNKNDKSNNKSILKQVDEALKSNHLNWVEERWGLNDGKYNTKKSAFWRVSRKLSELIAGNTIDPANSIVYSNLYKFAKEGGGNPSEKLACVQYDICKHILESEIDLFRPKKIVFLTGKGWAKEFLDHMKDVDINEVGLDYVSIYGKIKNARFVVADHPQGKNEECLIDEIQDYLRVDMNY